jgi:selT/selW/selH-like putative selenoprotein
LTASSGGVFEVMVDGVLVHSKRQTGLFPDEDVLLARIGKG